MERIYRVTVTVVVVRVVLTAPPLDPPMITTWDRRSTMRRIPPMRARIAAMIQRTNAHDKLEEVMAMT